MKLFSGAKGYHLNALAFRDAGKRTSLVFNTASVAIENYLLAICEYHGIMPLNHSYGCLMNAVDPLSVTDEKLSGDIRSLDRIFGICSVDAYHHGTPESADSERALHICERLKDAVDKMTAAKAV
jgi:hypothetical protein